MDPLSIVAKASLPLIAKGSAIPEPVLSIGSLYKNLSRLKSNGAWIKGVAGHYSLPLILDDGKSSNRPCLISFAGHSKFGLGFFEGNDDEKEQKK